MGVPTRSSLPSWAHKGAPSVWKIQSSHNLNHSVLPYGKRLLAPELQSYSYHVTLTGSFFFFSELELLRSFSLQLLHGILSRQMVQWRW